MSYSSSIESLPPSHKAMGDCGSKEPCQTTALVMLLRVYSLGLPSRKRGIAALPIRFCSRLYAAATKYQA